MSSNLCCRLKTVPHCEKKGSTSPPEVAVYSSMQGGQAKSNCTKITENCEKLRTSIPPSYPGPIQFFLLYESPYQQRGYCVLSTGTPDWPPSGALPLRTNWRDRSGVYPVTRKCSLPQGHNRGFHKPLACAACMSTVCTSGAQRLPLGPQTPHSLRMKPSDPRGSHPRRNHHQMLPGIVRMMLQLREWPTQGGWPVQILDPNRVRNLLGV